MSETTTITAYQISGAIGNADNPADFSITLTDAAGLTDASVLALAAAIKGVTYPPEVTCSLSVTKTIQTGVFSIGHLSDSPPDFV